MGIVRMIAGNDDIQTFEVEQMPWEDAPALLTRGSGRALGNDVGFFIFAAPFVLGGLSGVVYGLVSGHYVGVLGIGFVPIGLIPLVNTLFRPRTLRLTAESIVVSGWRGQQEIPWSALVRTRFSSDGASSEVA
jgi:hypothetical protein